MQDEQLQELFKKYGYSWNDLPDQDLVLRCPNCCSHYTEKGAPEKYYNVKVMEMHYFCDCHGNATELIHLWNCGENTPWQNAVQEILLKIAETELSKVERFMSKLEIGSCLASAKEEPDLREASSALLSTFRDLDKIREKY